MALYLSQVSYTPEGVKGLMKEGGSKRATEVKALVERAGGKVHTFHFALGSDDVILITEFSNRAAALAVSMAVNASGAARIRQTELIDPSEIDAATKVTVGYRPPGA